VRNFISLHYIEFFIMSSLSNNTSDIKIENPEQWKLVLRLDDGGISFIAYCEEVAESIICRDLRFDAADDSYLKSLENCIYDNDNVFLLDYKSVTIEVESMHFSVMPPEIDEAAANQIFHSLFPSCFGNIRINSLKNCNAQIVFEVEKGIIPFLDRTFNSPAIYHHLYPVCEYFRQKCADSDVSKMFLNLRKGMIDLCAFRNGSLLIANSFKCNTPEDSLFFALHAWQEFGLDVRTDEMQLSGDSDARTALSPLLKRYISYVMPAIFPAAALKLGQDAMKAPFDLILMSLCV
jgi:hypothetical protein